MAYLFRFLCCDSGPTTGPPQQEEVKQQKQAPQMPLEAEGLLIINEYFRIELVPQLQGLVQAINMAQEKYESKVRALFPDDSNLKAFLQENLVSIKGLDEKRAKKLQKLHSNLQATRKSVKEIVMNLRQQVIEQHGRPYRVTNGNYKNLKTHYGEIYADVRQVNNELQQAFNMILAGKEPHLKIVPDDPKVDKDSYLSLVCKQLAVQRYQAYRLVRKFLKEHRADSFASGSSVDIIQQDARPRTAKATALSQTEIAKIEAQIDLKDIAKEVFNLYGFNYKYDPLLSMRKLQSFYQNEDLKVYLECVTQAHEIMLSHFIFAGKTQLKMEENPILAKDLTHGQPPVWTRILDSVIDNQEQQASASQSVDEVMVDGASALGQVPPLDLSAIQFEQTMKTPEKQVTERPFIRSTTLMTPGRKVTGRPLTPQSSKSSLCEIEAQPCFDTFSANEQPISGTRSIVLGTAQTNFSGLDNSGQEKQQVNTSKATRKSIKFPKETEDEDGDLESDLDFVRMSIRK